MVFVIIWVLMIIALENVFSLQLGPQDLNSRRIILPENPTQDIAHKLGSFKVIVSVFYYYEKTQAEIVS